MKRIAIMILLGAFALAGCGRKSTDQAVSPAVSADPEPISVSSEVEEGVPGNYEYIGNRIQTSAEPIVLERGYFGMLEDDLDADGVDETIMLTADSDGENMNIDIEIYEPGEKGVELTDSIHREMKREDYMSQSGEWPVKYHVYLTDHIIQLKTQNVVQEDGGVMDVITSYQYDGSRLTEKDSVSFYLEKWRNENTRFIGAASYLGYVQGTTEFMQEMPTGYCMSLLDGSKTSSIETDRYTIAYPEVWNEYIETGDESGELSGGYEGTAFASNTLKDTFSEEYVEKPYRLFSIYTAPVEENFDGSGGRIRFWCGDSSELIFEDGGDWVACLMEAERNSGNTEELLRLHTIVEEAENILPVTCSYTGTENGQIQNPFFPDYSDGEEVPEDMESDSAGMDGSYSDWKEAYLSVLHSDETFLEPGYNISFALIYVDDDDIPELVVNTNVEAGGCQIYSFHDGNTALLQTSRLGFTYIEKGDLLCNSDGHMDYYYDMVFRLSDGAWEQIGDGAYGGQNEGVDEESGRYICSDYSWDGEDVTREEYMERLSGIYDFDKAVEPQEYYTGQEMEELLHE